MFVSHLYYQYLGVTRLCIAKNKEKKEEVTFITSTLFSYFSASRTNFGMLLLLV